MNRRMRAVAKYYFLIEGVRKWLDKLGAVSPGMRLSKCYRYKSQTCHNNANQKFRKPHSSTFVCVSPSAVRDQSIRGRPSSAFSIEHHHNQSYLFRVEEGWMSLSLSLTRCLCIYIYYIKFSFLAVLANMRDDKVRLKSDDWHNTIYKIKLCSGQTLWWSPRILAVTQCPHRELVAANNLTFYQGGNIALYFFPLTSTS